MKSPDPTPRRKSEPTPPRGGEPAGPYVVVDVEYVNGAFEIVMTNIGTTPAFHPRVAFSRRLVGAAGETVISDLPIWSKLGLLPPGRAIRVFVDAAPLVFQRKGSKPFRTTVSYDDDAGRSHKRTYEHDFEAYRDVPQIENG